MDEEIINYEEKRRELQVEVFMQKVRNNIKTERKLFNVKKVQNTLQKFLSSVNLFKFINKLD